jgi:hypothetical protein
MMVMMIARTPSLKASSRVVFMALAQDAPRRRRLPREKLWRVDGVGRKGEN